MKPAPPVTTTVLLAPSSGIETKTPDSNSIGLFGSAKSYLSSVKDPKKPPTRSPVVLLIILPVLSAALTTVFPVSPATFSTVPPAVPTIPPAAVSGAPMSPSLCNPKLCVTSSIEISSQC